MGDPQVTDGGAKVPERRLGEQGQMFVDDGHCRGCGADLGAGYLCDECDIVTVHIDLTYHSVADLRRELCDMVDIETTRYGEGSQRSLTKPHLCAIADALGVAHEGLTLAELYPQLCDAAGVKYNANAGNQWKLARPQLKALYQSVAARHPNA